MTATIPSPAPTGAAAVLAHHDALLDVFASITQDCVLAGLMPVHVTLAAYSPGSGFLHVSVQFTDVDQVDVIADVWKCRPDAAVGTNYTRQGSLDVNGRTVTISVYTGRPKLPAYPTGYAPVAVTA